MPTGPGKYDHLATIVRERAKAKGMVLFIQGGEHGDGFSVQCTPSLIAGLPNMLRDTADEIERLDSVISSDGDG